jgi:hypothetical protein
MPTNTKKPDFKIRNIEDWTHFCTDCSLHKEGVLIQQLDDLNFESVQDCQYVEEFNGTYDGGGFLIKNFSITEERNLKNAGLFSVIGATGHVSGFNMEGIKIHGISAGSIAGRCSGKISNISLEGVRVFSTGEKSAGGAVGVIQNGCITEITAADIQIKGSRHSGGIVGSGGNSTLSRCSLSDVKAEGACTGGVVGYIKQAQIQACSVQGLNCSYVRVGYDIIRNSSVDSCMGGIAGYSEGCLSNCFIENISGDGFEAYGGISGEAVGDIIDSYVDGITCENGPFLGGVVGRCNAKVLVERCLVVRMLNAKSFSYAGGVIGRVIGNPKVANSVFYSKPFVVGSGRWLIADCNEVENCWATRNSGAKEDHDNKNGSRLSAEQARQERFYEKILHWNFGSTWKMDEERGHPVLLMDQIASEEGAALSRITAEEINRQVCENIWLGGGLS